MRRVARLAIRLVVTIVVVTAAGVAVLESPWGKERVRRYAIAKSAAILQAQLSIGQIRGNWWSGTELRNVMLVDRGEALLSAEKITVSYHVLELLRGGRTRIRALRIEGLHLYARRAGDGSWNLSRIFKPRRAPEGPPRSIIIDRLDLEGGTVTVVGNRQVAPFQIPAEFRELKAALSFSRDTSQTRFDVTRLSARAEGEPFEIRDLAGGIGLGDAAVTLRQVQLRTLATQLTVDGQIKRGTPAVFDLNAIAPSFDFQEMSRVLPALRTIDIDSSFSVRTVGPRERMRLDLKLRSSGGDAAGQVVVNFLQPGWHAAGALDIRDINLARWFSKPDRVTRITGATVFDLDLGIGRHFPTGTFSLNHGAAQFAGYAATNLSARGRTSPHQVLIEQARGIAYGATFTTSGSVAVDDPYQFRLAGHAAGVDLRRLPKQVPVPHVTSTLAFQYDAVGRFARPQIAGNATFGESMFIGAAIGAGTTGSIDTTAARLRYSGEGTISGANLGRFGRELEVHALTEPRFAGLVKGTFQVSGEGTEAATLTLDATGQLRGSRVFNGMIRDAAVTLGLKHGNVIGSFDGQFERIDLARALEDERYTSQLTGSGKFAFGVRQWLLRVWSLDATTANGTIALQSSSFRSMSMDRGELSGVLQDGALRVDKARLERTGTDVQFDGTLALARGENDLAFTVHSTEPAALPLPYVRSFGGDLRLQGHVRGAAAEPQIRGTFNGTRLHYAAASAADASGTFSVTLPDLSFERIAASVDAALTDVAYRERALGGLSLRARLSQSEASGNVTLERSGTRAELTGRVLIHPNHNEIHVEQGTLGLNGVNWRMEGLDGQTAPAIQWREGHLEIPSLRLVTQAGDQRLDISGTVTWNASDGHLKIGIPALQVATIAQLTRTTTPYQGLLAGDIVVTGNIRSPAATGDITVTSGALRNFRFDRLASTFAYAEDTVSGRVRIDQAPGVWLEATGKVPRTFGQPGDRREIDIVVKSSPIDLALLENIGVPIADAHGTIVTDVTVRGTAEDPHATGKVTVNAASFRVPATGAKYSQAAVDVTLAPDLATVNEFHVEDDKGDPLDISGTIATHELKLRELALDISASRFELLSNETGDVDVDALLQVQGPTQAPVVSGDVILRRAQVNLNSIIARVFRQPYRALGPDANLPEDEAPSQLQTPPLWNRLTIALRVSIPDDLTLRGDQISPSRGAVGLGDVRITAGGDLSFRKAPADQLQIVGPLRIVRGTYAFQGRRFDLQPDGEVRFVGQAPIDPLLSLMATRNILGVETRVAVKGTWRAPELQLSSSPPLEEADILSLIVFNQPTNELISAQRTELAFRAAALASGFVTTPLLNSVSRALGFDTLAIEPAGDVIGAARLTASRQFSNNLFVTFIRQLGAHAYDEVQIEYVLSTAFRIRSSVSDADVLVARQSLFERVQRLVIELLFLFSY